MKLTDAICERIYNLEKRLEELENNRAVMRAQRDRSGLPKLALVGYTNAGKSTLLNRLTDAKVLAENKLFATLDPTTRKMTLPCGESVLITDTVGFIRKLPHHLVKAFKSTLDEVRYADILMIVSDISDPEAPEHLKVTENVISELGGGDKPVIYVYTKSDMCSGAGYSVTNENTVIVSAKNGEGINSLLEMIERVIHEKKKKCKLLIPYGSQSAISTLYDNCTVNSTVYADNGVLVEAILDEKSVGQFSKYIVDD